MTSQGGAELARSDLKIAELMERLDKHTRSNRSYIYDMVVTLTSRRDYSVLDIESNLGQMVNEVKGELVEVQCVSMGEKIDNSAVLKSRQDYCAELSSAGPCGIQ